MEPLQAQNASLAEGGYCPQLANIQECPMELIYKLANGLDSDDLLALRMTCKKLNVKIQAIHHISLYRDRKVYFVPTSLDNLLKISRHVSGVNRLVQSITIRDPRPYHEDSTHDFESFRYTARTHNQGSLLGSLISESTFALKEIQQNCSLAVHSNIGVLSTALSLLPNLRIIKLGQGSFPYERNYINLFYPTMGLGPGTRAPRWLCHAFDYHTKLGGLDRAIMRRMIDTTNGCTDSRTNISIVPNLLEAIILGRSKVEILRASGCITSMSYFDMHPSRLPLHKDALNSLTELSLKLDLDAWITAKRVYARDNEMSFFIWLDAVGSNLQNVKLSYSRPPFWQQFHSTGVMMTNFTVPPLLLGKLRSLKLYGMYLDAEDFILTLQHTEETLEILELTDCLMINPAEDWFNVLKAIEGRSLKRLRIISNVGSGPLPKDLKGNKVAASLEDDFGNRLRNMYEAIGSSPPRRAEWYRGIAPKPKGIDLVTLPSIAFDGNWTLDTKPNTKILYYGSYFATSHDRRKHGVIMFLNLRTTLQDYDLEHHCPEQFWEHISCGHWLNQPLLSDELKAQRAERRKKRSKLPWGQWPADLDSSSDGDSDDSDDNSDNDAEKKEVEADNQSPYEMYNHRDYPTVERVSRIWGRPEDGLEDLFGPILPGAASWLNPSRRRTTRQVGRVQYGPAPSRTQRDRRSSTSRSASRSRSGSRIRSGYITPIPPEETTGHTQTDSGVGRAPRYSPTTEGHGTRQGLFSMPESTEDPNADGRVGRARPYNLREEGYGNRQGLPPAPSPPSGVDSPSPPTSPTSSNNSRAVVPRSSVKKSSLTKKPSRPSNSSSSSPDDNKAAYASDGEKTPSPPHRGHMRFWKSARKD